MESVSPAPRSAGHSNPIIESPICGANAAPFDLPFDPFADTIVIEHEASKFVPPDWLLKAQQEIDELRAAQQAELDDFEAWCAASDAEERRFLGNPALIEQWKAHWTAQHPCYANVEPDIDDARRLYMDCWLTHQGKLAAKAQEPKPTPTVLPLFSRYVFIRDGGDYYDLNARKRTAAKTVHLMAGPLTPDGVGGAAKYTQWKVKTFDRTASAPDKPAVFTDENGLSCLNTYRPSGITPLIGSARPWLDHVHKFFGDDVAEREYFLDWLSFKTQHPSRKVRHGVILQSGQGVGKDTMADPLFAIFGENIIAPDNERLLKGQMGFLENKLMVVIKELKARDNKLVYDRLKPVITEDFTEIELKFLNPYTIANLASVLCFTNHEGALYLEDSDRRWFMYASKMKPEAPAYYKRLHDWLDNGGAAYIYRHLLDRDVSHFKPDAPPPMTEAKRLCLESSRGETRNGLLELWEDQGAPFGEGVAFINLREALNYLQLKFPKLTEEGLKRFLRDRGAQPFTTPSGAHEPVRFKRGHSPERKRLWLLRGDPAAWRGKSQEELGAAVWRSL